MRPRKPGAGGLAGPRRTSDDTGSINFPGLSCLRQKARCGRPALLIRFGGSPSGPDERRCASPGGRGKATAGTSDLGALGYPPGPGQLRRRSVCRRLHVTLQVRKLVHAAREAEIPKSKGRNVPKEGPGSPGPLACTGAPTDPDLGARHAIVEICRPGLAAVAARRVEPAHDAGSGIHRRAVRRGLSDPRRVRS